MLQGNVPLEVQGRRPMPRQLSLQLLAVPMLFHCWQRSMRCRSCSMMHSGMLMMIDMDNAVDDQVGKAMGNNQL